jgi:ATP-binding protein involved in chromosome partitioning
LLAQIPLVQSVREAADIGRPAVLQDNTDLSLAFIEVAQNVAQQVAIQNSQLILN